MAENFEPFDFDALQNQAAAGELDLLIAFTSDGAATVYASADGQKSVEPAGSYQVVSAVRGPRAYPVYYKCKDHHLLVCYIDQNGNERCSDTGRSC